MVVQRNNVNNTRKQQSLLCFLSLIRHSMALEKSPKKNGLSNAVSGTSGVFLLRRNSYRYRQIFRHRRLFFPILFGVLVVVVLFLFLSLPISDDDHRHRVDDTSIDVHRKNGVVVSIERDLWSTSSSGIYYTCSNASKSFISADAKTKPHRYLLISTSGGLNQQRTGIIDAVVAAYILNATLIVPVLDQKSYWKDVSDFGDIFDVNWFISFLSNDIKILKQLPLIDGKVITPVRTRVPRKCSPKYYLKRILPLLNKKHAVQLTKFDYRLSNNLDTDLQKLRCRVNYHALRFTDPIVEMGRKLVARMRTRSDHFIALHLRFEPDMLAFSGCDYGGGEKEREELGTIRRQWKTLHKSNPDKQRRQGKCPLTPEEVGLMLRALGYNSDVHIYVASGEVYGGEETLAPLRALFPNFHSKDTLASQDELAPFAPYSARMAALDFIVCDESDVFVTNNNGNMARILAGRRRYFGHKPTIRPNAKKISRLFLNQNNMTWEEFAYGIRSSQVGFMGEPNEVKLGRGEFHENPSACICESSLMNNQESDLHSIGFDRSETSDYQNFEDEQDMADLEDVDSENTLPERLEIPRDISKDPRAILTSDQPEEELLSD
ncbi:O-fucosyltransferase 6-like [Amaranthus tricolor]|uniref:O-fucosyltransferase 6-like n=1 Tax=Amaranthus tricolor TaxID=29722 RepID=UPI00258E75E5|nr:O-fucosyltransferase 6-like [Amaranthus tricolor]